MSADPEPNAPDPSATTRLRDGEPDDPRVRRYRRPERSSVPIGIVVLLVLAAVVFGILLLRIF